MRTSAKTSFERYWTFEGIMGEIQEMIFNGKGLDPDYDVYNNLWGRIKSLKSIEQQNIIVEEINKAKKVYERRVKAKIGVYPFYESPEEKIALRESIKSYREEWRKKSWFYKILNKSKNPKNIVFANFTPEEVQTETSFLRR